MKAAVCFHVFGVCKNKVWCFLWRAGPPQPLMVRTEPTHLMESGGLLPVSTAGRRTDRKPPHHLPGTGLIIRAQSSWPRPSHQTEVSVPSAVRSLSPSVCRSPAGPEDSWTILQRDRDWTQAAANSHHTPVLQTLAHFMFLTVFLHIFSV